MKSLCVPIITKRFVEVLGKTAIEFNMNNSITTVFANGNQEASRALLVNVVVNEVGDSFVATNDSKTLDPTTKKPIFMKGDVVIRQKQTCEFKSFAGENSAAEFAQSANAFGLTLNVVMAA